MSLLHKFCCCPFSSLSKIVYWKKWHAQNCYLRVREAGGLLILTGICWSNVTLWAPSGSQGLFRRSDALNLSGCWPAKAMPPLQPLDHPLCGTCQGVRQGVAVHNLDRSKQTCQAFCRNFEVAAKDLHLNLNLTFNWCHSVIFFLFRFSVDFLL